jgi:hypothetical protein
MPKNMKPSECEEILLMLYLKKQNIFLYL